MTSITQNFPMNGIADDLAYLQAELARIDILIQHEVQRWQAAGQNLDDNFRGLYVTDADANTLLERPFATSWGQNLTPGSSEDYRLQVVQAAERSRKALEVFPPGRLPRLAYLADTFGLDRTDQDILLICLAPALDLRYERLYGYLQDDVTRKRPLVNLALELLAEPGIRRYELWQHFQDDAPLFRHRFIEKIHEGSKQTLLTQTLHIDEALVSWLLGQYKPGPELGPGARLSPANDNPTDRLLAGHVAVKLDPVALKDQTIVLLGLDHARKAAAARQMAAVLERPLLSIQLEESGDVPVGVFLKLCLRDARLNWAVAYISGWEILLGEDSLLPPTLQRMLVEYPDVVIIASQKLIQPRDMPGEHSFIWLTFDQPDFKQRRMVWEHLLDGAAQIDPADIDAIAGQFQLTAEQIRDAYLSARAAASQQSAYLGKAHLFSAARAYSNRRLSSLANRIESRYSWDDIILPPDQVSILGEIINTVRVRPFVLEEWGLRQKLTSSAGVATLFAGPPGTGKTMAAEIIANELGLDLYKIDLSTVVSKYIGETEKNISKIFQEAETSNAILFFDEADALFGKRSEVRDSHDRYANIEISYLLQRMEAYDGVTILATNLRANLDEAFTRRLQFIVDFPFPQEDDRLRIWKTLFPKNVPIENDLDFVQLARRFKLAGANIRNIIVSAIFLAASDGKKVKMQHLLHGTHRELQKMRRLIEDESITGHIGRG